MLELNQRQQNKPMSPTVPRKEEIQIKTMNNKTTKN